MALLGRSDLSRADEPQIYGGLTDVTGRLSRSATIALIASPVGLLLISVARLLIISNYDTTTASAIVSSGGYVDTLLGTTIPLIPIFLPYIALALLYFNRVILGILALGIALIISPTALTRASIIDLLKRDWNRLQHASPGLQGFLAVMAFILLGLLIFELLRLNDFFKTLAVVFAIVAIPVFVSIYPFPLGSQFYSELVRQPWLPANAITLRSGQEFTGYILSDDPSSVAVLSETTRTVTYYPPGEIVKMHLCHIGQTSSARPLFTLAPAASSRVVPVPECQQGPSAASAALPGSPRTRERHGR
jgi:hypothetical protein